MSSNVSVVRRHITFTLLFLVAIVSYIDRQIFTLFQDDIKLELGLTDGQLGLLTGLSFALFYTLAAFPFALGFALSSNAYVALGCFVVVKFMMTLHLGPIIALCYAQVSVAMRAMMSATINMMIGFAGTGIGGTAAGFASQAFAAVYGEKSLQPALALISCCLLIGGFAAIMAGRTAIPLEVQE